MKPDNKTPQPDSTVLTSDNIFQQITSITKAAAYDILVEQVRELRADNEELKKKCTYNEKVAYDTSKKNADLMAENETLKAANTELKDLCAKQHLENESLKEVVEWIAAYVLTAKDGGEAWCSVRNNPGAREWINKMKELVKEGIIKDPKDS